MTKENVKSYPIKMSLLKQHFNFRKLKSVKIRLYYELSQCFMNCHFYKFYFKIFVPILFWQLRNAVLPFLMQCYHFLSPPTLLTNYLLINQLQMSNQDYVAAFLQMLSMLQPFCKSSSGL